MLRTGTFARLPFWKNPAERRRHPRRQLGERLVSWHQGLCPLSLSEVIAIYPITPASPRGEHAADGAAQGSTRIYR